MSTLVYSMYSVTLTEPAALAAPSDGFIDNTPIPDYMAAGSYTMLTLPAGCTFGVTLANARANARYQQMINAIQTVSACNIWDETPVGASVTAAPGTFMFKVAFDRGDDSLVTWDETTPGQTLSGSAALVRCIARAYLWSSTQVADVIDPTPMVTVGTFGANIPRVGERIEQITIGSLVASLSVAGSYISVTEIS